MIRTAKAPGGGLALFAELPSSAVAYVDADWVPALPTDKVPALVLRDGSFSWDGGEAVEAAEEPDASAAAALLAVAAEAATALDGVARDRIDVVGRGFSSGLVRQVLELTPGDQALPPEAVVDVSGDVAELVAATRRLAPLGTLVVMGEPSGRSLEIDLYPDVHVRGLRLVGAPLPLSARPPFLSRPWLDDYLAENPPAPVHTGDELPDASWFKIAA
jgi:hypothetical protein